MLSRTSDISKVSNIGEIRIRIEGRETMVVIMIDYDGRKEFE